MTKIYLSPSSQSDNKYAWGDYTESEVCRKICEYEKKILEHNGFSVKLATKGYDINQRIAESNGWGADVHQPTHTNAGGGDGTLVMCYTGCKNDKYVKAVYESLASYTPTKDDGIRINTSLAEINGTVAMCVYIEVDFHDDSDIAKWIVNHMEGIAEAIVKGYCKAEGKTYKKLGVASSNESKNLYKVQIGAYKSLSSAEALAEKASKSGFDCYVYPDGGLYKVQAGAYKEKKNADSQAKKLKARGFSTYVYKD